MPELLLLRPNRAVTVAAFERESRAYFVAPVSDQGDDYIANFEQRFRKLPIEQGAGLCHFDVLVGVAESSSRVICRDT